MTDYKYDPLHPVSPQLIEEAAAYILEECGGMSWWRLSRLWKQKHAQHMAEMLALILYMPPPEK